MNMSKWKANVEKIILRLGNKYTSYGSNIEEKQQDKNVCSSNDCD